MSKKAKKIPATIQKAHFLSEVKVTVTLECCICTSETYEEEFDGMPLREELKKFINEAYKKGWRESVSSVFLHQGIHCPICHKNRNNEKHFE